MKKLSLLLVISLFFISCASPEVNWEFPISVDSSYDDVSLVLGLPEIEVTNYDFYSSKGFTLDYDGYQNVRGIHLRGEYLIGEDETMYDGLILSGISMDMNINQMVNRLGGGYEIDVTAAEEGGGNYIWHFDGYDVDIVFLTEDVEKDGEEYKEDSVMILSVSRALTKEQVLEGEGIIQEFNLRWWVLHKDQIFGTVLSLNEDVIGDFETSNIFTYGERGNYYYMKDSSVNDLNCAGETLTKIEKFSGLNEWCLYYEGEEYIAVQQPHLVTDDFIVYSKCLEAGYLPGIDMNGCLELGLMMNNKQIDVLSADDYGFSDAGYFEQFSLSGDEIVYNKNGDGFVSYDTTLNEKSNIDISIPYDTPYDFVADVYKQGDDLAYVIGIPSWPSGGREEVHTLYYEGKSYYDVFSFEVVDGDLYYVKRDLEKEGEYMDIYKVSLIKNDLKIDEFYVQGSGIWDYRDSFIDFFPFCKPQTGVCVYDSENYVVLGVDYHWDVDNEYGYYSSLYEINGDEYKSKVIDSPFYVYLVIEDGDIEYLLSGSPYHIRKGKDGVDYKLYEGDYPMSVYKK
jgi:hypothetical protein